MPESAASSAVASDPHAHMAELMSDLYAVILALAEPELGALLQATYTAVRHPQAKDFPRIASWYAHLGAMLLAEARRRGMTVPPPPSDAEIAGNDGALPGAYL